jgi:cation:H+ antiporter
MIEVAGILISLGALIWGTRISIAAFDTLSVKLGVRKLALAAVFVAISTSLPELFVSVAAVAEGTPEVSVGNVLGSNLANIGLIVGGSALVAGSIAVVGDYLKREFASALIVGILPFILFIDGGLDVVDGFILIGVYFIYVKQIVFAGRHVSLAEKGIKRYGIITRLKMMHRNHAEKILAKLLVGVGIVIVSADVLVKFVSSLALGLGVSVFVVSFLVVAVGTSLPELVLSLGAIARKETALMFGNILGSTVVNSTLILGITAVLSPVAVNSVKGVGWILGGFVLLFVLFWWFSFSRRRLTRIEGGTLLVVYFVIVLIQIVV